MLTPALRGFASVLTVLAAVAVSKAWGDTVGQVTAAVVGALLIISIEGFVQWSPKHLQWARALFDPRAVWTGVWLQEVQAVTGPHGILRNDHNTCAVIRIAYQDGDGYRLEGHAFDANGAQVAMFRSLDWPTFTKDGRTMSYVWSGNATRLDDNSTNTDRSGLANVELDLEQKDRGTGTVQHVGQNRELVVTMNRATEGYIRNLVGSGFTPAALLNVETRLKFGAEAARALEARRRQQRPVA